MCRILFEFQGRPIYAYWFFYALGMFLAGFLGFYLAYRRSQKLLKVCILCLAMIIFAFAFGRLNAFCLKGTFSGFFDLRGGGQVSFGGVIGALFILIVLARILRLPTEDALDISACAIPVAQGIQRIGCFCHGCCYGPISNSILSVRFPKYTNSNGDIIGTPCFIHHLNLNLVEPSDTHSLPVFPIQLVAVAGCLLISGVCLWMLKQGKLKGRLLWFYFALYGAFRFTVQWFRPNYDGNNAVSGWNSGHTMSVAMLFIGIIFLALSNRNKLIILGGNIEKFNERN